MSVYEPENIKRCKTRIRDIDQWLENYTGNDKKLIDKKLNDQEACIKEVKQFQNNLANRKW